MPGKIGKFIVGAVIAGAALALPGLGVALSATLKGFLLSMGASMATGALLPSGMRTRLGAITLNDSNTLAPIPVAYGRTKLGLRIVDIRTGGSDNKDLYIVGALCHGSTDGTGIQAIEEIFLDERLAVDAAGNIIAPFTGANLAFRKHLGTLTDAVDPDLNAAFPTQWPPSSKGLGIAYLMLKLKFDPEIFSSGIPNVTVMVRGAKVNDLRSAVTIQSMTNATPVVVTTSAAHGLTTGDRVTIYTAEGQSQGFTTPVTGIFTVTVTNSTTFSLTGTTAPGGTYTALTARMVKAAYSTNPIACALDVLTSPLYGLGASLSDEVNQGAFAAEANYCDELINKNGANTDLRFTANGFLDVGQSVQENLRQLMTSCRANLVYEGGRYRFLIRRPGTPTTLVLDESVIVGDWDYNIPGVRESPNTVEINYVLPNDGFGILAVSNTSPIQVTTDANHGFVTGQKMLLYLAPGFATQGLSGTLLGQFTITVTSANQFTLDGTSALGAGYVTKSTRVTGEGFPYQADQKVWPLPGAANAYLTADNGYESRATLELPFTTDGYTALQLGMVAVREGRSQLTVTMTCTEMALQLAIGDIVPVTHSSPGWVSKNFWVMAMFTLPTGLVRLTLTEYDINAYSLDALTTLPTPPRTNLPNPFTATPPTGLTLSTIEQYDADGVLKAYVQASWTAAAEPFLDYYACEYKANVDSAWLPIPDPNRTDTVAVIGPWPEGVGIDVRIKSVNTLGVSSAYATQTNYVPSLSTTLRPGSQWVDDFSTQHFPGRRWVQQAGLGSGDDIYDPDALVGGKVARIINYAWYEHKDNFPFDPNQLYVMRWRVRQLIAPSVGSKLLTLGIVGIGPDGTSYVNTVGQNSQSTQHFLAADSVDPAVSQAFTDYYAFFKGFAGGQVALTAGMLSNSGLGSFSAANLVDASKTTKGFDTNTATSGAYLQFDLGALKQICGVQLYADADDLTTPAVWKLAWSDTLGGTYTDVMTGMTADHVGFTERVFLGANKRYWRLILTNTPGAGPNFMEVRLLERVGTVAAAGSTLRNPSKLHPGIKYFRPMMIANYNSDTGGGVVDVDVVVMTIPAGAVPDQFADQTRDRTDSIWGASGRLNSNTKQDDGASTLALVKGMQRGSAQHGDAITFPVPFQSVPRIAIYGGLTYQPDSASWSPSYNSAKSQYDDSAGLNPSTSGFTVRARLRQFADVIGLQGNGWPGTVLQNPGDTDTVTLTSAPSRDDNYQVKFTATITGRSKDGQTCSATVVVAIDSSSDSGVNWTQRATVALVFVTSATVATPIGYTPVQIVNAAGLDSTDKLRLRFVSVTKSANCVLTVTNVQGVTASGIPHSANGVYYETSSDSFASKTPNASDHVTWEAMGYV